MAVAWRSAGASPRVGPAGHDRFAGWPLDGLAREYDCPGEVMKGQQEDGRSEPERAEMGNEACPEYESQEVPTSMEKPMEKPWFKFYEPGVPRTISYPDVPLYQLLEDSVKRFPQNPALIFLNGKMTYAALDANVNRFANALSDLGVKKGDRVAIYTANCPQYVISYYAILKIGAIIVPIN
ncbi:MAG: AMP-binding protein, partial [Chloroflexota bacterium]|nr:AMP-binding protein [Chloroflexota bacterium]